jgi:hypothetical protein
MKKLIVALLAIAFAAVAIGAGSSGVVVQAKEKRLAAIEAATR